MFPSRTMRVVITSVGLSAVGAQVAAAQAIALRCIGADDKPPEIYEVTDQRVTLNGKPVPALHITITDLFITWDHSAEMNYAINVDKSGNCDPSRAKCYEHRSRGLEVHVDRRTGAMEVVKVARVDQGPEQREITKATCEQFKPGPVKF